MLVLTCISAHAWAQPAAPTVTGNKSYCAGTTISLTASSPAAAPTYTWTGPGVSGTYTGATLTIAGASAATAGTYNVTVTSGGQTSAPTSTKIIVVATPTNPYAPTPTYSYCQGANSTALNAVGVNMLWYTTATGGVGNAVPPSPSTAIAGTYYYYVSQTVNGCESGRTTITVNIKAKPSAPLVNKVVYCQNDVSTPLAAAGANLLWYTTSSGGIGSPIAPTPITSYANTVYYYVSQTANGCESDRTQVPLIVNYRPNALIVASRPFVCQHDTISFIYFGNAKADASYNWSAPSGNTIVSGAGQGAITVRFDQSGKQPVTLIVSNNGCSSAVATYNVDVRQSPVVPVTATVNVCIGQTAVIGIGYANEHIDNYVWDFDNAHVIYGSTGGGPYGLQWDVPGTHIVQLTTYSNSCPSVTTRDTINVRPLPDAHIEGVSNNNICAGDSIAFTAESYNPAYHYQWQPTGYFGNVTNLGTVYGFIDQPGYISLKVTSPFGCEATDSTLITARPCCSVYFPNAFTPNGDGRNDIFRPLGSGGHYNVKVFRVADRWGQLMYETTDFKTGWDGKHNGAAQDMGSYYYFIEYTCPNGKTFKEKGEVLLVR